MSKVRIRRVWTSLLEEGNAFEADVVKGVEDAGTLTRWKFARMRCRRMMSPASIKIKE